jgi:integrase/recombinase XerC
VARLPATDIKPFHVVEWADSHGDAWSNAYRRGGIIAIQRPFNWAEELGYISANPIKKIAKPQPQRREQIVTLGEWASIRDRYADGDPFRDILEFGWESGCRPQEAKRIEPRHVDLDQHRIAFPPAEAKGKKRWRIIYLTPKAEAILRRRLKITKKGPVFRNEDGEPWTAQAMSCRFARLKKHLGVKFAAYSIRHGFCQRKLEDGIDHLTVAALLGHADGKMVAAVYSHMNKADAHLREALTKESANSQV